MSMLDFATLVVKSIFELRAELQFFEEIFYP